MQGFAFEDLLQIQLIEGNNPVLSIADCSCLYLAEKLSGTSDSGPWPHLTLDICHSSADLTSGSINSPIHDEQC